MCCTHRGDDELLANRHRGEELIELPSGARQRKRRIFEEESAGGGGGVGLGAGGVGGGDQNKGTMGSNSESELRRRRGGQQTKEGLAAKNDNNQNKKLPNLKVFSHLITLVVI